VFVYNNQPGVSIDYDTGESWLTESGTVSAESNAADVGGAVQP